MRCACCARWQLRSTLYMPPPPGAGQPPALLHSALSSRPPQPPSLASLHRMMPTTPHSPPFPPVRPPAGAHCARGGGAAGRRVAGGGGAGAGPWGPHRAQGGRCHPSRLQGGRAAMKMGPPSRHSMSMLPLPSQGAEDFCPGAAGVRYRSGGAAVPIAVQRCSGAGGRAPAQEGAPVHSPSAGWEGSCMLFVLGKRLGGIRAPTECIGSPASSGR